MGLEVLADTHQNEVARAELRRRGLDCLGRPLIRRLRSRGMWPGINVGDPVKSWDVLRTIELIESHLARTDPILDVGAHASEVLCILHKMGFARLKGIDLNPRVLGMPDSDTIEYVVGDLMATPFPAASFKAITAISVIEHGFDRRRLLAEASRLLTPGGLFIASTDYWEQKVDTCGVTAFGMEWTIFSREDLAALIEEARSFGLEPTGSLKFDCTKPVVNWNGRIYTFAWFSLAKRS